MPFLISDTSILFYFNMFKFKNLTAVALGMKTATVCDGIDEANGEYIIETKQVDVLA